MKRPDQIAKVIILTLSLMIFLLNFHQTLSATEDCMNRSPIKHCEPDTWQDCEDACYAEYGEDCGHLVQEDSYCEGKDCIKLIGFYCPSGYIEAEEYWCGICYWK